MVLDMCIEQEQTLVCIPMRYSYNPGIGSNNLLWKVITRLQVISGMSFDGKFETRIGFDRKFLSSIGFDHNDLMGIGYDYMVTIGGSRINDFFALLTFVARFIASATISTDGIPHLYVLQPKITEERIIPGPTGILQAALLYKNVDVMKGGPEYIMSIQEYVRKTVEDEFKDDHFMRGQWLSAVEYLDVKGSWQLVILAI
ncbi:hypothetical protein Tco_0321314 [Tanacetum coccineum]